MRRNKDKDAHDDSAEQRLEGNLQRSHPDDEPELLRPEPPHPGDEPD